MTALKKHPAPGRFSPFHQIFPNQLQNVLVVEDCEKTRTLLTQVICAGVPCNVIPAENGSKAMSLINKEPLDLVILDLLMPGVDGYTILKSIKSSPKLQDAPVIVLTGVDKAESASQCLAAGADDYLVKPYDLDLLRVKITSFLEKKRLLDAQREFNARMEEANAELLRRMGQLEREIAERKAAEEAGREGEARFRILSEAAFEGVVIHRSGIVLDSNSRFTRMFSLDPRMADGLRILDLVDESVRKDLAVFLTDHEEPWSMETAFRDGAGNLLQIELQGRSIPHQGKWASVLSFRDVTRRKEAERGLMAAVEEAKSATEIKDKFIALLSHNLREPVATVVSMLNALANMDEENEIRAQLMNRCVGNANSLHSMIERLLGLGKLRRGKIAPNISPANGRAVAEEVAERMYFAAQSKNVLIENRIPPGWGLNTDSELLSEALHNLISNAVKFSYPGGRVEISLIRQGGNLAIAVRDYGMGVPPEYGNNLFLGDQKYRSPGSNGEKGLGIGLALTSEIMAALGGAVSLERPAGGGALFCLLLPRAEKTMLLVADTHAQTLTLSRRLAQLNADLSLARGAGEALELAAVITPDAVVAASGTGSALWLEQIRPMGADWEKKPVVVALLDSLSEASRPRDKGIVVISNSEADAMLSVTLRRLLDEERA